MVLSSEVAGEVVRRARGGESFRKITVSLGVPLMAVKVAVRGAGGSARASERVVRRGVLSWEDRTVIFDRLRVGGSYREIATELGCSAATVCREVARGGGAGNYRPSLAQRAACRPIVRSHPCKLDHGPLRDRVEDGLRELMSPEQIAGRLRREFGPGVVGEDSSMTISHETIYKTLFVQGKGQLRRELSACLRTGRALRRVRGERSTRGQIPDKVMISDRPAEIEDRAVPGHWEGDLIIGSFGRSAIGTLVERTTRFVILLHLPADHGAEAVRHAINEEIMMLPTHLRRSLTWDQGKEMAQHVQVKIDTGLEVFFCDPHSPWQRGSNENTNGLLRQYFPKSTDLAVHSAAELRRVADQLNARPRKTLSYATPAEQLTNLLH